MIKVFLSAALGAGLIVSTLMAVEQTANDPGKKIFDSKCITCHGADGKGKPMMAKMMKVNLEEMDLTTADVTSKKDEELLKIISGGKNKMPPYGKQLKEDEQKAVLQYLRALSPKKTEVKQELSKEATGQVQTERKQELTKEATTQVPVEKTVPAK